MVFNATFQQYFSYIVEVSLIGGGNLIFISILNKRSFRFILRIIKWKFCLTKYRLEYPLEII
jgi:hypothetical protein